MKLTGSQIIMEVLIEHGVDVVFGYPGGTAINLYDSLYTYRDRIRHVLSSHEQGAAHAADGYARSSGKPGVVMATSGPGATNLVTGIATAYMDSIPLIAITVNVPTSLIGRDSFQEIDIAGITMPITKHNYIVKDIRQLADTLREAFQIACSGRPGPVLVDIPKDVTIENFEFTGGKPYPLRKFSAPDEESINQAIQMIKESTKPLIYAGGGIIASQATNELSAFSEKMDAPVALSLMGISALPSDHHRNLGLIGMHGTPASNKAVTQCDLLVTIGARFSDRVSGNRSKFAKEAKVIHIDADPSEHGKNIHVDLSIHADAKTALKKLTDAIEEKQNKDWNHMLTKYKAQNPLPTAPDTKNTNIRDIIKCISGLAGEDAIIVTDVGQHQMITAQYYQFVKPRSFISSCGLGTMGFGMGAAIGVKIANPNRPVILITGDGCFHMNMSEMACAVTENLPIIVFVMNNGVLGMVRQWQRLFFDQRYSATDLNRATDFVKLAQAFGAEGFRIDDNAKMESTIKQVLSLNRPCIIDCPMTKDDYVFPMIPPNGSAEDIIFCE